MYGKVKISKSQLDRFRKLSRKYAPFEIQAYLIGEISSLNMITVDRFAYTSVYRIQTINEVQWGTEEFNKLKQKVESDGLKIVGDIHSHPEADAVMSKTDYIGTVTENLALCGICSIYGKHTKVRFWTPTSALPCEIVYK
jgi:proteasome lid subunit RPN8/RPN11